MSIFSSTLIYAQANDTTDLTKSSTSTKESCRGPNCLNLARAGSVYCSEMCIRHHADESLQLLENEWLKGQAGKAKAEVGYLIDWTKYCLLHTVVLFSIGDAVCYIVSGILA